MASARGRPGGRAALAEHIECIRLASVITPLHCLPPQVRQESGINSFADVAKLLEGAPRPLLDTLRLGTVVRHSGVRCAGGRHGHGCAAMGLPWGRHSWFALRQPSPILVRPPSAATLLGATLGDRLRINAKWAVRGMYAQHGDGGSGGSAAAGAAPDSQPLQFVGGLQARLARWRLSLQVGLLRFAFWLSSVVHSATTYLVPMAD